MAGMNDLSSPPQPSPPEGRPARQRKPDWIRVRAPVSEGYNETRRLMRELNLHTVCEEAACPNIGECWTKKHATVMILGDVCTRACAFCNVKTGMPKAVDPFEPENTAIAAAKMGLEHIVITSVDRDDLADGGASQFVKVIEALRRTTPNTTIEILTPDFRGKMRAAVEAIMAAGPDGRPSSATGREAQSSALISSGVGKPLYSGETSSSASFSANSRRRVRAPSGMPSASMSAS